ncbi:MAG: hypothetical protein JWM23_937 [Microbacteriaceae bacterium]|jgi:hypothetical protein|nr:hypothetical protein [Microbacteriaceae bacterium]
MVPAVAIVVAGLVWSTDLPAWVWPVLVVLEVLVVSIVGIRLADADAFAAEDAETAQTVE